MYMLCCMFIVCLKLNTWSLFCIHHHSFFVSFLMVCAHLCGIMCLDLLFSTIICTCWMHVLCFQAMCANKLKMNVGCYWCLLSSFPHLHLLLYEPIDPENDGATLSQAGWTVPTNLSDLITRLKFDETLSRMPSKWVESDTNCCKASFAFCGLPNRHVLVFFLYRQCLKG